MNGFQVAAEYQQTPMDSVSPQDEGKSSHVFESINQNEVKYLASTLDYILLVLGQLCQQKEVSTLAAMHFSTSLEGFISRRVDALLAMLDSFEILTKLGTETVSSTIFQQTGCIRAMNLMTQSLGHIYS